MYGANVLGTAVSVLRYIYRDPAILSADMLAGHLVV